MVLGHHCFATKSTKSSCFCNAFDEICIHKQHQKHKSEGFIEWNLHRRSEWLRGWHTCRGGELLSTLYLYAVTFRGMHSCLEPDVALDEYHLLYSLHYTTLITAHHDYNCNCACKYTNYTTLQLQLHYAMLQLQLQLQLQLHANWTTPHYIQQLWVRWPCNHGNHFKKHNSNRLTTFRSISGFVLPSEIHNNQPLLLVSYFWNFRHRLVWYYWYIYIFLCMLIWFQ